MTAKSTKTNSSGSVFYNVWGDAKLSASESSALTMPETDSLGISDDLCFGGYDANMQSAASDFTSQNIFEEFGKGMLANL